MYHLKMNDYIVTIGLEIHIKLKSINKMFCQCKNEQNFDTLAPNSNICPVCTGQPWALPTISNEVIQKALLLGKALQCKINTTSTFDRKSYFYPDLPMGYQITQLYKPTNGNGKLHFFLDNYTTEKIIHIQDAHMECDTAKMIHHKWEALLDFNRAWTPLIEIVTLPDFRSTEEVTEFLKELQRIVRYNDIADADMEKWQMRVDVNISIRKSENDALWTRVEVKNINSFWAIRRAIDHEYKRQAEIYDSWNSFEQQTRWWDDTKGESYLMRSKEDALDYRYFPEPDLPPLEITKERLTRLEEQKIDIPYAIIKTFKETFNFNKEYINALIGDKKVLDYFTACAEEINDPKVIAKRIAWPIAARMKENNKTIDELPFWKEKYKEFLQEAQTGNSIESQLKIVMEEMLITGKSVKEILKEKWFDTPSINEQDLKSIAQKVINENPTIVEQYKKGKTTTIWFFVGQIMKLCSWKVNPKTIEETIKNMLT